VPRIPLVIKPDGDDPDCAEVLVDGTIGGRPYRFMLDTGAARTQVAADQAIAALVPQGTETSSGVFADSTDRLVSVSDVVVGPITVRALDVVRAGESGPAGRSLLGMDVLRHWCCHFEFGQGALAVTESPDSRAGRVLELDDRGHAYVEVSWPGVTGRACWDSGSGITIVDQAFLRRHPGLFAEAGSSVGTDATGARARTPMFAMAAACIGGALFQPHRVAGVDLSGASAALARPMDLILGYTTLRQANWLLDFPARRWAITRLPASAQAPASS
jgi:hypothetical protein